MHACAGLAALNVVPGVAGYALAAALLGLGLAAAWSRALLKARSSVRVLELGGEGAAIELADGARFAAPVSPRRYVSRFAVALALGAPAARTVLVTRDMLDADSFRALRIWALWGKLPVAPKQLGA